MDALPLNVLRKKLSSVDFSFIPDGSRYNTSLTTDVSCLDKRKLFRKKWQTNGYISLVNLISNCTNIPIEICDIILDMTGQKWNILIDYYQDILYLTKPYGINPYFNPSLLEIFSNELHYQLVAPRTDTVIITEYDIKHDYKETIEMLNFINSNHQLK